MEGISKIVNDGVDKVVLTVLDEVIKRIARLELQNNASNNSGYRDALLHSIDEVKQIKDVINEKPYSD